MRWHSFAAITRRENSLMAAGTRPAAPDYGGPKIDPLRFIWALLANVKFALLLVGVTLVACLIGIVIPQMPAPMSGNPPARTAWLELQREDYGALTGLMERLGVFEIFHATWFNGLWLVVIVAVTVCTVSRFRPTARSVHRPVREVGERYFETAHHRANFAHAGGAAAIEAALRRRRYRVERTSEGDGAAHLFAQRYAWAAYGTFLSHLALLMLLVGALLTRFGGYDQAFVLAESTPAMAVFDRPGPNQLFIKMVDAHRGIDEQGNVIDFHSDIEVMRGDQTVRCKTTVNDPCHAFGYKVHQAAFFDDVARLRITAPDGRLVYDDVLDFQSESTAVPVLRVTDLRGNVLFEQAQPQQGSAPESRPGANDALPLAVLVFPTAPKANEAVTLPITWRIEGNRMRVAIADGAANRDLLAGEAGQFGDYRVEFLGPTTIPAIRIGDMPGGDPAGVTVQMPAGRDGSPYLVFSGLRASTSPLGDVAVPGVPYEAGNGYTYTFQGRVEASGISVKRDPGDTFIWVAVGLALIGLGITFYVPRRRVWVRVEPDRTYLAGVAERSTRFSRELRRMGAELGAKDALLPEDTERD